MRNQTLAGLLLTGFVLIVGQRGADGAALSPSHTSTVVVADASVAPAQPPTITSPMTLELGLAMRPELQAKRNTRTSALGEQALTCEPRKTIAELQLARNQRTGSVQVDMPKSTRRGDSAITLENFGRRMPELQKLRDARTGTKNRISVLRYWGTRSLIPAYTGWTCRRGMRGMPPPAPMTLRQAMDRLPKIQERRDARTGTENPLRTRTFEGAMKELPIRFQGHHYRHWRPKRSLTSEQRRAVRAQRAEFIRQAGPLSAPMTFAQGMEHVPELQKLRDARTGTDNPVHLRMLP